MYIVLVAKVFILTTLYSKLNEIKYVKNRTKFVSFFLTYFENTGKRVSTTYMQITFTPG